MDDIIAMRRSCRLNQNTSGRRPLGSSSRLLKVPHDVSVPSIELRSNLFITFKAKFYYIKGLYYIQGKMLLHLGLYYSEGCLLHLGLLQLITLLVDLKP